MEREAIANWVDPGDNEIAARDNNGNAPENNGDAGQFGMDAYENIEPSVDKMPFVEYTMRGKWIDPECTSGNNSVGANVTNEQSQERRLSLMNDVQQALGAVSDIMDEVNRMMDEIVAME